MQILLTTEVFLPRISGLVTAVKNIAEALVDRGEQVWLACPDSASARRWSTQTSVSLLPMGSVWLGRDLSIGVAIPRIARQITEIGIDVTHAHSPGLIGRAAIRASRRRGIPAIATIHTLPENLVAPLGLSTSGIPFANRALADLICRPFKQVDVAIAPSIYAAKMLRRYARNTPQVVSNGVSAPAAPPSIRRRAARDPLRALYVGRLQKEKMVEELIFGLVEAHSLGTDITLTVVGDGPMEQSLRSIAGRLGVASKVSFAGRVSSRALEDFRNDASLFCTSSRAELQGCAILEAMACGLPIVGARAGAIPETAPDHRVGRLYSAGDVRALGMTFRRLASDSHAYRRYSEGALKQADAHSLERTADRLRAIYAQATH